MKISAWREECNQERPHSSLGYQTTVGSAGKADGKRLAQKEVRSSVFVHWNKLARPLERRINRRASNELTRSIGFLFLQPHDPIAILWPVGIGGRAESQFPEG